MDLIQGFFDKGLNKISGTDGRSTQNDSYAHGYGLMMNNARELENIEGFGKVTTLPNKARIGVLSAGAKKFVFLGEGSNSEIGVIENDVYSTLLELPGLNFNNNYKIKADVIDPDTIVFTDDLNSVRYLRISTASLVSDAAELELAISATFFDYEIDVEVGGNLSDCTLFFTYAYESNNGVRSDFLIPSPAIYVHNVTTQNTALDQNGAFPNTPKNRRVVVQLSGRDTRYNKIIPAVLYYEGTNNVLRAKLLPAVSTINNLTPTITINSLEGLVDITPEQVLLSTVQYDKARTLKVFNNVLFLGGVSRKGFIDDITLQGIANTVSLELVKRGRSRESAILGTNAGQRVRTNSDGVWGNVQPGSPFENKVTLPSGVLGYYPVSEDGVRSTQPNYRSLKPGEAYNFSIAFQTDQGLTSFYHIPYKLTDIGFSSLVTSELYPADLGFPNPGTPFEFHRVPDADMIDVDTINVDFLLNTFNVRLNGFVIPPNLTSVLKGYVLAYQERTESNIRYKGTVMTQRAVHSYTTLLPAQKVVSQPIVSDSTLNSTTPFSNDIHFDGYDGYLRRTSFAYSPDLDLNRITIQSGDTLVTNTKFIGRNFYVFRKENDVSRAIGGFFKHLFSKAAAFSRNFINVTNSASFGADNNLQAYPNVNQNEPDSRLTPEPTLSGFVNDTTFITATPAPISRIGLLGTHGVTIIQHESTLQSVLGDRIQQYGNNVNASEAFVNYPGDPPGQFQRKFITLRLNQSSPPADATESADGSVTSDYTFDVFDFTKDSTLYSDYSTANYVPLGYRNITTLNTIFSDGDTFVDFAGFEKKAMLCGSSVDNFQDVYGGVMSFEQYFLPFVSRYTNFRTRFSFPEGKSLFPFDTTLVNIPDGSGILLRDPNLGVNTEYNPQYTLRNNISGAATNYLGNNVEGTQSPYSVVYSQRYGDGRFNRNNFRKFLAEDRYVVPFNYGEVNNFFVNKGTFYIHTEGTILRTFVDRVIQTPVVDDVISVLTGSGSFFEVRPEKAIDGDYYGGCIGVYSNMETIIGYLFVDEYSKSVFIFDQGLKKVSANLMENFFTKNITFRGSDHTGDFYSVGYDTTQDRIFVTKKFPSQPIVSLYDDIQNDTESFTIHYNVKLDTFESFETFLPDFYVSNKGNFELLDAREVNRYGIGERGQYGAIINRPVLLKFTVDSTSGGLPSDFIRLLLNMSVTTPEGVVLDNKFFKFIRFDTDRQNSGFKETINYLIDDNVEDHEGKIIYTLFRDGHRVILPEEPYIQNRSGVPAKYNSSYNYQSYDEVTYERVMNGNKIKVYLQFENEYNIKLLLKSYMMQVKKSGI